MNSRTKSFFESERGVLALKELTEMAESKQYQTRTAYSASEADGLTFVDKHMKYMSQYPTLNCAQYISNLKLMTKASK